MSHDQDATPALGRRLKVTRASEVTMRRIRWLWDLRIVLAGLTLLAGREGLGKSTLAVDLAAQITNGVLDGEFKGEPRAVIYVHSEDARDYTIVPRLVAAGADLDRVIFLDAVTAVDQDGRIEESEGQIVLPLDDALLAEAIEEHDAALVILDAATSVIDSRLDGDKDRAMRQGLERIARVAQRTGAAVLGIVHFGKRESADTGKLILGSIAWSQVARSVLAVALDADSGNLVVSTTKGNLGPGASSLSAQVVSHVVDTVEGPADVGCVRWLGETEQNASDLLGPQAGGDDGEARSAQSEALDWIRGFLADRGGSAPFTDIKEAAKADDIAERTLKRARGKKDSGIITERVGFGQGARWSLSPLGPHSGHSGHVSRTCAPDGPNGPNGGPNGEHASEPGFCRRCDDPADRLVTGLCHRCAYPAGDGMDTEGDE